MFRCDSIPPAASTNDLSYRGIVIALSHIEPKQVGADLWLCISVLLVEHLVEFEQEFLIYSVEEIWRTNGFWSEWTHTVTSRDWDLEVLEELNQLRR